VIKIIAMTTDPVVACFCYYDK